MWNEGDPEIEVLSRETFSQCLERKPLAASHGRRAMEYEVVQICAEAGIASVQQPDALIAFFQLPFREFSLSEMAGEKIADPISWSLNDAGQKRHLCAGQC